jgi:predicted MFS family arabinose efflux permease
LKGDLLFMSHVETLSIERRRSIDPRIFLLTLGTFALGTDAFVVAGVLPAIAHDVGITEGVAGQLVTAFSLTYGIAAPLTAALTSRWSRNYVLVGSLLLFCLANVLSAIAPSFVMLMFSRILAGIFACTYVPLAYATAGSLAPEGKRGQAIALVVIGITIATALGSPFGTWIGEHFGWRQSFFLVVVLSGLASLGLIMGRLPKAAAAPSVSLRTRLEPMLKPRLVLALVPMFFCNIGVYAVYTYIAPLLHLNLPGVDVSGLLVLFGLGAMFGTIAAGRLVDRFRVNRLLMLFLSVLIVVEVLLALATAGNLMVALLALLIWGFLVSVVFVPQQERLLRLAPQHAQIMLALNNSMYYLGIATGSAVGGLSLRIVDVTQLVWIGGAGVLMALLLLLLSIRIERKTDIVEQ